MDGPGKDDSVTDTVEKFRGLEEMDPVEAYVQQMVASGYDEQAARIYAEQYYASYFKQQSKGGIEPESSKWQADLYGPTGVFELADEPPAGVLDLSDEAITAWEKYQENSALYPLFVKVVGGGPMKAAEIKGFLDNNPSWLADRKSSRKKSSPGTKGAYSEPSWDDLEFDFDSDGSESTPPILGLAAVVVIGVTLYLDSSFTMLGVLLISFSLGFHIVALIWLEILNMPFFESRSDMSWIWSTWAIMLVVSMAASATIIVSNFSPSTQTHEFSMIIVEGQNAIPHLEMCLALQIILNSILILSMQDQSPSSSVIRSPWTIASTGALVLFSLILISPEHQWISEMVLMILGATIIGSSAWIYGRSETQGRPDLFVYMLIPSVIGYLILENAELPGVDSDIRNRLTMISFIAFPLILNTSAWVLPKKSDDMSVEGSSDSIGLNLPNMIILGMTGGAIVLLAIQTENIAIPLIPLLFSLTILDREHSRKLGGDRFRVHRILPRDPSRKKKHKKVKMKFSILGATGTGKTSFTAALWTLLTTRDNRDIWWSEYVDSRETHRALGEEEEFLKALAKRGGITSIEQMMEYRIAKTTCSKWIEQRKIPRPGPEEPFPFRAEAFGKSQSGLNELKFGLINPDAEKRYLPQPTINPGKVEMTISFHADIEVVSPSFLFNRKLGKSRKGQATEIELKIITWDIKGESFSAAVDFSRELANRPRIRKSQMTSAKITRENLDAFGDKFASAEPTSVEKARELFLKSSHTVLIVDLNDLLDDDQKDVEKYIRLMHRLNRDNFCDLDSLTILLNKADELFDGTAKEMTLRGWDEMNDASKAEEILNRASNFALDELMGEIPVDVEFVCAFGGLVPVLDSRGKPTYNEDGEPELRSAYPMIPVNVLEPIIEVILTSRLHSEEI